MKKKIINGILVAAILVAVPSAFVSCKDNDADLRTELLGKIADLKNQLDNIVLKAGPQGEQGVAGKDGKDGSVVTIGANGNWFIDGKDTGIPTQVKGDVGAAGADGHTPEITIGDNGNWFVDGKDTGKQAVGKDGKDGKDGANGTNATVVEIREVDGVKYWFIDGNNTGVVAEGKDGTNGIDGQNGTSIINIGDNGNWFIDGKDSGVPATGPAGANGADGKDGVNGADGKDGANGADGVNGTNGKDGVTPVLVIGKDGHYYWWIDGVYTGVRADGIDGTGIGGDVWTVNPDTKTWVINGEDTHILAYTYEEMVQLIRSLIYDAETGKLTPELEDQIKKLLNSLEGALQQSVKEMVTGVIVERTINSMYGQLAIPGWNPLVIAAYYGNAKANVFFPEDAIDIKGVQDVVMTGGQEIKGDGGKVYLTLNPNEVELNGKTVSLESSTGKTSNFTLKNLTPYTGEMTFGWTRASENGLYEATAELNNAAATGINVNSDILKNDAKQILKDLQEGGKKNAIKSLATFMADAFTDISEPMPAYSVKVNWNDPLFGPRTVRSGYKIAAFSLEPLDYDFEYALNADSKPYIDKVQFFIDKVINNVNLQVNLGLPSVSPITITKMDLSGKTIEVQLAVYDPVWYNTVKDNWNTVTDAQKQANTTGVSEKITLSLDTQMEAIAQEIYDQTKSLEEINALLAAVQNLDNNINITITKAKNSLKAMIHDYLGNLISRINTTIGQISLNKLVQPTLFVKSDKGISRATGEFSGTITLLPTSYTAELLAPAYKKFIAVTEVDGYAAATADNPGQLGEILDGDVQEIQLTLEPGKTYTIAYSAVDYKGNIRTNYYTITGK